MFSISLRTLLLAGVACMWLGSPAFADLVTNGNFSGGDAGFLSDYDPAPGLCWDPGVYKIVTSPQDCHPLWASFGDHTGGSGSRFMMAVNGAQTGDEKVWSETISVAPNTQYYFSTWIASSHATSPAQLDFSINGTGISSIFTAPAVVGEWKQFYATWYSGATTQAVISIVNQNTLYDGNDFALDDISFDTTVPNGTNVSTPEPSSLVLLMSAAGAAVVAKRRRQKNNASVA